MGSSFSEPPKKRLTQPALRVLHTRRLHLGVGPSQRRTSKQAAGFGSFLEAEESHTHAPVDRSSLLSRIIVVSSLQEYAALKIEGAQ